MHSAYWFKYSIGAPVFEKVTIILGEDEHPIHRRIGGCL
jgi:hypothetical protein